MIKMFVTKAVISKGFDGAPALKYSEGSETPFVRFRIGVMVYDKRAEKEHRFVNITVKAFGYLVDRIRNMKLDAGSYVNIVGRYDEDTWEDQSTREKRSAPVLIVDEIEYGTNGSSDKQNGNNSGISNGTPAGNGSEGYGNGYTPPPPPDSAAPPNNFTGFEGFGGSNPFFPEN
jgi:single-stranded DNA-binding protein